MKKILIIGKRGFIGNSLYKYLKKFYKVRQIRFKDLNKFKSKINNFNHIINTSINENYINNKYNKKFDNDLKISGLVNTKKIIYTFISTRKVYPSKANERATASAGATPTKPSKITSPPSRKPTPATVTGNNSTRDTRPTTAIQAGNDKLMPIPVPI